MKKVVIGLVLIVLGYLDVAQLPERRQEPVEEPLVGGFYTVPTYATSSAGVYSWSTVLSPDSSRGYVSICNNSIVANDAVYLGLGATSTKPFGIRLPSGECYEMNVDNMYYGPVYAIASTATTTLLNLSGGY